MENRDTIECNGVAARDLFFLVKPNVFEQNMVATHSGGKTAPDHHGRLC